MSAAYACPHCGRDNRSGHNHTKTHWNAPEKRVAAIEARREAHRQRNLTRHLEAVARKGNNA